MTSRYCVCVYWLTSMLNNDLTGGVSEGGIKVSLSQQPGEYCPHPIGTSRAGEEVARQRWSHDERLRLLQRPVCCECSAKHCLVFVMICVTMCVQHKITQQEQMIKQLRKKQKELKDNSEAMTNQKSNFLVS